MGGWLGGWGESCQICFDKATSHVYSRYVLPGTVGRGGGLSDLDAKQ